MKTLSLVSTAVALSAFWSLTNADVTTGAPGIRVIGQSVDGTLVLDDSSSELREWASPGLFMPTGEPVESAPTLLVVGQVEEWDAKGSVLTVSGQRVTIGSEATILDAPRDVDAALTTQNLIWYLHKGSYVAVAGDTYGGGESLATHVIRLDNDVKPGTAPIYVRGSVDFVDDAQGVAYIGNTSLDLNSASVSQRVETGNIVEAIGYHAADGSAIVSQVSSLDSPTNRDSKLTGINGSGLKGINGSGLKGINGSGLKGINGSGLKGINGSGLKGINGSGLKGINGSGLKGINGSGLKGINGSGLKGINGSGLKGINGSGLKGINGSGLKGINGSGLKGINGSGLKGINGSGLKGVDDGAAS